jgi:hypothetical protein
VIAEKFPDESGPPPPPDDAFIPMTAVEPGSGPGRVARR